MLLALTQKFWGFVYNGKARTTQKDKSQEGQESKEMNRFIIILNNFLRFASVLSVFVGGLWVVSFIDEPTWKAARWVIFMLFLVLANGFFGFGGRERYCSGWVCNE